MAKPLTKNYVGQVIVHASLGDCRVTEQKDYYFETTKGPLPFLALLQTNAHFADAEVNKNFIMEDNWEDRITSVYKGHVSNEVLRSYLDFAKCAQDLLINGPSMHYDVNIN